MFLLPLFFCLSFLILALDDSVAEAFDLDRNSAAKSDAMGRSQVGTDLLRGGWSVWRGEPIRMAETRPPFRTDKRLLRVSPYRTRINRLQLASYKFDALAFSPERHSPIRVRERRPHFRTR